MEGIYVLVVNTLSMVATIFTAILAFITFKRYVLKESYFGIKAEEQFKTLELDGYLSESYKFEGGNNKKFPHLLIDKKWGKIIKVTYYVKEGENRLVKTWFKKGI